MKENILSVLVFALILSAAVSCRLHSGDSPADSCEIAAPMDSLFGAMFPSDEPGAIVGVSVDGKPVYLKGFGKARLDTGKPYTDSTSTNICSATRSFVTAAILKLAEDGRLSLNQTIADYFPNFTSPVFHKVTLRHILSNSTGLPDKRPRNPDQWTSYIKRHDSTFGISEDYMLYGREPEMIRFFESVDRLEAEPGTTYRYQDPPFMLLSTVIEKASGMSFEQYMTDSIFTPAGLTETHFFEPDQVIPNEAHGYAPAAGNSEEDQFISADGKWEEYDYGEASFFPTRADRGIYTTARDYFKWIAALYGGRIIDPVSVAASYNWQISTRLPNIGYGLGVFLESTPGMPFKAFHMSYNGGFSIYQCYFQDQNIFVFVFSNRPDWDRLATGKKISAVLRNAGWI